MKSSHTQRLFQSGYAPIPLFSFDSNGDAKEARQRIPAEETCAPPDKWSISFSPQLVNAIFRSTADILLRGKHSHDIVPEQIQSNSERRPWQHAKLHEILPIPSQ